MARRVVVTGLGAVTPLGNNVPQMWENAIAGRSGVGLVTRFDTSDMPVRIAAEVKDFDAKALLGAKLARRTALFTQYALVAAQEAVQDASLEVDQENSERVGVIIGSGIGGVDVILEQAEVLAQKGPNRVSPFMVPMMLPDIAAGEVSIQLNARGPNMAVVSACATGAHAIGEAADMIRHGEADVMICGGTEAGLLKLAMAGFAVMGALSQRNDEPERASRPFDAERDGFVMGEGCGILVLEELEHARKRGARIYAEVIGYGASADAVHITAPDPEGHGAALAMQRALRQAGISPEDVDYINAHGTSTPLNDRTETLAIRKVFGPAADHLAVSSTKSMMGHLLGAAGAVESVICVKTIETGIIPPTINYENPDPECDLDYVPNEAREMPVRVAMNNSFGFGGHNVSLIFRKFEG